MTKEDWGLLIALTCIAAITVVACQAIVYYYWGWSCL